MPCALVGSIQRDCKDGIGGIKEIKIKAHPGLSTITTDFTVSSGSVTAVATNSRTGWYTIQFEKEMGSFNANPASSSANGTTFYNHELKVMINKMNASKSYEIHLYAKNNTIIAVRDMNDRYVILGLKNGMDLSTGVAGTGTAYGDRNGYELTFTGKEDLPEQDITAAIWATLVSV